MRRQAGNRHAALAVAGQSGFSPGWLLATLALSLAACSSDNGDGSGGSGGDVTPPAELVALVGSYSLNTNWKGDDGDQAMLVVREPDNTGISEVALHDFDELDACYLAPDLGEASVDAFSDSVFLDGLVDFDDATLALAGDTLRITFFDTYDIDGDNDAAELQTVDAARVAVTETDITPRCP